ncbi:acylglycerol kinase, mitochondrial [Nilaparvata lugens]|uniref:acylglycerol kinase, mitochondrial n=1 Tax=Nilaparvata lugens TaxID=108931 RepID=UPI00193DFB64|nr:acylglycerol kinase, mitochondrial [Nilaparvata lugens]
MAKVKSVLTTLRNNWKKTIFFSGAIVYGLNYGKEKIETNDAMRHYCEEASKLGDEWIPDGVKPRHVTVILNPVANKRKAKTDFEKYCAPLLHLSGVSIDLLVTESAGQARSLVDSVDFAKTDAIVVAGGDGTLSEVVTGLMRRCETEQTRLNIPVGVLPLGRTNSFAHAWYRSPRTQQLSVHDLAKAAMTVVRGQMRSVNTMKIEVSITNVETFAIIVALFYCLSGIEWGIFRDANSKRDKYWYFGSLRDYAAYVFNAPTESYNGTLVYTAPCDGCSRCHVYRDDLRRRNIEPTKRWWHTFIPTFSSRRTGEKIIDYSLITNNQCGSFTEIKFNTVDFSIKTSNVDASTNATSIYIGPDSMTWWAFLNEGWKRVRGEYSTRPSQSMIHAQNIQLWPSTYDMERWLSIDSEDYEFNPISIVLLYNALDVLCPENETDAKSAQNLKPKTKSFTSSYLSAARSSNSFFQK